MIAAPKAFMIDAASILLEAAVQQLFLVTNDNRFQANPDGEGGPHSCLAMKRFLPARNSFISCDKRLFLAASSLPFQSHLFSHLMPGGLTAND